MAECPITISAHPDPYSFICTATDSYGDSYSDTVDIIVYPEPNNAPEINSGMYESEVAHTCEGDYIGCFNLDGTVNDIDTIDNISCQWIYENEVKSMEMR